MTEDERQEATTETHKPARPLKFFKDSEGYGWLCDKDIDPRRILQSRAAGAAMKCHSPTVADDPSAKGALFGALRLLLLLAAYAP
jgi:hypothetical protein